MKWKNRVAFNLLGRKREPLVWYGKIRLQYMNELWSEVYKIPSVSTGDSQTKQIGFNGVTRTEKGPVFFRAFNFFNKWVVETKIIFIIINIPIQPKTICWPSLILDALSISIRWEIEFKVQGWFLLLKVEHLDRDVFYSEWPISSTSQ